MEYIKKKTGRSRTAHLVLYELCNQLITPDPVEDARDHELYDALVHVTEATEGEDYEFKLFDALVNYVVDMEYHYGNKDAVFHHTWIGHQAFNGAYLENGAQRSVVGKAQA
eukprot:IDg6561t1